MQYLKIKEEILQKIESGLLTSGQKLTSERKLAEAFNTTRVTLREALSLLESEGRVYRENRRGWFISPAPLRYDPTKTTNFHNLALSQQRIPKTELLSATMVPADKQIALLLQIAPQTEVIRIHRVRYLDERPVVLVTNYVLPERLPNLLSHDLSASLTDIYQQHYDTLYQRTHYRIRSSSLVADTATPLRATSGCAAMYIERVNYDQYDQLLDCDLEYWRHDAVTIEAQAIRQK
ncbi:2-aminoethylphosphonate uptake and metabolism regulator [Moritella sp. JT01]|uniref:phosphonate utilization transcriptional regulator PhnR n=1 Tax=Moritella sp. JT01 TaxID=756698 RepID=UPI0007912B75|nr:phosphonate utilization transcriptional regulator PhnR [Moritella sp. JT01]KXO13655.1 2-aminoethylphosphonate uptake and metabolism regulator [Moritella sp. JT01]